MLNLSKKAKVLIYCLTTAAVLAAGILVLYLFILPAAVSNQKVINYVERTVKKSSDIDVVIKNPVLITSLSTNIIFKVDEITAKKANDELLSIKKLDTSVSFSNIFSKSIILNKIGLDYIFADINKLSELSSGEKTEQKQTDWTVEWLDSLLYIKKCLFVYNPDDETHIKILGKDLEITDTREPKFVRFKILTDIQKNKDKLVFAIKDDDKVFIKDHKLFIDKCFMYVNNSKVFVDAVSDKKNNFDVKIFSNNFDLKNVVKLLETDFIVKGGREMLSFTKNIKGNFDFKVHLTNDDMQGKVRVNKASLSVVPLNNLNVDITEGEIDITSNTILLKNFKGYYSGQKSSNIALEGKVEDYTKSCKTNIVINTVATNDFSKKHLSKIIGYPVELVGRAGTKIIFDSIYNKMDLVLMFKINKGDDLLVDGASFSPVGYDRAVKADLHFENNMLEIKDINYYIAQVINKNSKIKPILSIYGNVDFSKAVEVKNLGFIIPKPLPSEFLNVLIGQKVFKKGTIAGNLEVDNAGKVPVLKGNMSIKEVRIPAQRLSIKEGSLTTENKSINLSAKGRYKRSDYNLTGNILNEIAFPIIVKDINLTVDNIDIDRILNSFNSQPATEITDTSINSGVIALADDNSDETNNNEDNTQSFTPGMLIVENCVLKVVKGVYKDIKFGNLAAKLTLDKSGILQVTSNRFDFAEGISSCKVYCDLKNHLYSVKLGVKDINSDLIATTLLNLKREISGKASGIIALNTDDSLKLNGSMKFIVKNGTIGKIGLVEYVLKFAAVFRNPMAMMSPGTIMDLVNIPEGNFDKITGDLAIKDNVIEKIMIKSAAPQLSSFIVGRFDLEKRDATLRIYTKFSSHNKGAAGFLRNLSLNSLANRVPLSSRNDSNYYAAELAQLPPIDADERDCQVFLTRVDGDVERNNFISSLKKIK